MYGGFEHVESEFLQSTIVKMKERVAKVFAMSEEERNHATPKKNAPVTGLELNYMLISGMEDELHKRGIETTGPEFGPTFIVTENKEGKWTFCLQSQSE